MSIETCALIIFYASFQSGKKKGLFIIHLSVFVRKQLNQESLFQMAEQ